LEEPFGLSGVHSPLRHRYILGVVAQGEIERKNLKAVIHIILLHALNLSAVNPWLTCGQPGVNLGSIWGQHGVNMGSAWGQHGVNLGSTRGHPGVNLHLPTLNASKTSSGIFPLDPATGAYTRPLFGST